MPTIFSFSLGKQGKPRGKGSVSINKVASDQDRRMGCAKCATVQGLTPLKNCTCNPVFFFFHLFVFVSVMEMLMW